MSNNPNENKIPTGFPLEEDNDEIDLGDLLATLTHNKWPIIFLTLCAVTVGTAKILVDTPIYQVDALLQVEEYRQSLSALESLAELLESKTPTEAEMEIIRSRMILGAAVKNLKLQIVAKP
ncbi:MAG: Wzz/FepE/Etk N-terminal domain-containing protein, partial [Methylococcales bacterium]